MQCGILAWFTVLCLVIYPDVSFSQENDKLSIPEDFKELERLHSEHIHKIYGLMYEISTLFTELERAVQLEKKIEGHKELVYNVSDDQKQYYQGELAKLQAELDSLQSSTYYRRQLEHKHVEVLALTDQLQLVGSTIADNPEIEKQKFKTNITWIFAALVLVVIAGFFMIAFKDERIRKEIFSGQAGIQFLTLFSLVIAMILFGITEILEGRELAALFGGISGYILGRTTVRKDEQPGRKDEVVPPEEG